MKDDGQRNDVTDSAVGRRMTARLINEIDENVVVIPRRDDSCLVQKMAIEMEKKDGLER